MKLLATTSSIGASLSTTDGNPYPVQPIDSTDSIGSPGQVLTTVTGPAVQWRPTAFVSLVDAYGADPTGVADSRAAIQAGLNALSAIGGTAWLEPGTYKCGGSIAMPAGTRLAGSATGGCELSFTAGGLTVSASNVEIEHITVLQGAAAGPALDFLAGGSPGFFYAEHFDIVNSNTARPMVRCGTDAGPSFLIFGHFEECHWIHATGASVPGVQFVGVNGSCNSNTFENIWGQSDLTATAPFFYFSGQATTPGNAPMTNLRMTGVVLEQCVAGALRLRSVQASSFENFKIADIAPSSPTNHIIDIGKDLVAPDSEVSADLLFVAVQCDVGDATHQTLFYDGTLAGQAGIVCEACILPAVSNNDVAAPSIVANGCTIGANYGGAIQYPGGVYGVAVQPMVAGTVVPSASIVNAPIFQLTGALGAPSTLQLPLGAQARLIDNQTTGGQVITVQGPSGAGVALSAVPGKTWVYSDGTNFY